MPTIKHKVARIAAAITSQHSDEMITLVSMHHFCKRLMRHYGKTNNVTFTAQIGMLNACLLAYLQVNGIDPETYEAAKVALESAGEVLNYLDSLPE